MKRYGVKLSAEEQQELKTLVPRGRGRHTGRPTGTSPVFTRAGSASE